jgi:hypothetical protein
VGNKCNQAREPNNILYPLITDYIQPLLSIQAAVFKQKMCSFKHVLVKLQLNKTAILGDNQSYCAV